jgi:hypothetical protein
MLQVERSVGHHHDLGVRWCDAGVAEAEGAAAGSHHEAPDPKRDALGWASGRFDQDHRDRIEDDVVEVGFVVARR